MYTLLLRHIGLMTLTSTIKTTAAIMMAARVDFGMNAKYGVKNRSAKITRRPGRINQSA